MFLKYLLPIQCFALLPTILFDYDKKGKKYIIAYLRGRRDFTKRGRYKKKYGSHIKGEFISIA